MTGIGVAVVRHVLHFTFDPAIAVSAPASWTGLISAITCVMGAVVVAVGRQYDALLAVLAASTRRAEQLQRDEETLLHKQAFLDAVVDRCRNRSPSSIPRKTLFMPTRRSVPK